MSSDSVPAIRSGPNAPAQPAGVRLLSPCRRGHRILILIATLVILGLADLVFTLTYMSVVGMVEVNPIARYMAVIDGPRQLVLYKLATIAVSCGVLFLSRRHRAAEMGAWACTGIMVLLTIHWDHYNRNVGSLTSEIAVIATAEPTVEQWVRFTN